MNVKHKDDNRNQIIHLTNPQTIKTSSGCGCIFALTIDGRITLVGGSTPDGFFTADTVLVYAETNTQTDPVPTKVNANSTNLNTAIDLSIIFLLALIWSGIISFLRLKKRKSLVYLLFFTIFYIYIAKVLDYTLFQFQSLLILKQFVPGLILNGITAEKSINLIPLVTLTLNDLKTSLLNILLMVPFGFGLPFITNHRMKKIVFIGALFSIAIELLQLVTGLAAQTTFRIADINDIIFNTLGCAIGYILFFEFLHGYRRAFPNWKIAANPILRFIGDRPQIGN